MAPPGRYARGGAGGGTESAGGGGVTASIVNPSGTPTSDEWSPIRSLARPAGSDGCGGAIRSGAASGAALFRSDTLRTTFSPRGGGTGAALMNLCGDDRGHGAGVP